jgi:hypothetical protein
MARVPADSGGHQDRPSELASSHRGIAGDLQARLAGLADSHPSAAAYGSDQPRGRRDDPVPRPDTAAARAETATRERQHGDTPRETSTPDYPRPDDVHLTAERRTHILDGDAHGKGGHRHGTGLPDKTEFPGDWDDDHIVEAAFAVARHPGGTPEKQNWNDRWQVEGTHDDIGIIAIVRADGLIWTAWPVEGSPGVVRNGPEET